MSEAPSILFDETTPLTPDMLGAMLFADDPTDPRSKSYARRLDRPAIHWGRLTAAILVPTATCLLLRELLRSKGSAARNGIPLAGAFLWCFVRRTEIALTAVRLYQRFAPDSVRKRCRFEPSCSEYMILAIEKYGFFTGIRKGIDRLRRCGPGNGGFDAP